MKLHLQTKFQSVLHKLWLNKSCSISASNLPKVWKKVLSTDFIYFFYCYYARKWCCTLKEIFRLESWYIFCVARLLHKDSNARFLNWLFILLIRLSYFFSGYPKVKDWIYKPFEISVSSHLLLLNIFSSNDICGSDGVGAEILMCPTCNEYCDFTRLNSSCIYSKVWCKWLLIHLFSNSEESKTFYI